MGLPVVGSLIELGKTLIERVIPDPKQKAEALLKLQELEQSGDLQVMLAQSKINELQAASADPFASRARPFIMWVCGVALAIQLVIMPLGMWGATLAGRPVPAPEMNTELLTTMLISMLGLGGMRSFDKWQTSRNGK